MSDEEKAKIVSTLRAVIKKQEAYTNACKLAKLAEDAEEEARSVLNAAESELRKLTGYGMVIEVDGRLFEAHFLKGITPIDGPLVSLGK